ncbi:MAG TPA: hypothetical protein V6C57_21970 [Coleofasciculaceae cyanobacterium]
MNKSLYSSPGSRKCTCGSITPGNKYAWQQSQPGCVNLSVEHLIGQDNFWRNLNDLAIAHSHISYQKLAIWLKNAGMANH